MLEDLRVLVADLHEVLLCQLSDGAVLERNNRCGGQAVVDEGDLAEELALAQDLEVGVLVGLRLYAGIALLLGASQQLRSALSVEIAVAEVEHALTLGNDVQVLAAVELLDDHVIRCLELRLHQAHDRPDDLIDGLSLANLREGMLLDVDLRNLHHSGAHLQVALDDFEENFNRHLLLKRRADLFKELLQL